MQGTGRQLPHYDKIQASFGQHDISHVLYSNRQVQLKGGVGEAGDSYEKHADQVANLVVQGKSVEQVLNRVVDSTLIMNTDNIQTINYPTCTNNYKNDKNAAENYNCDNSSNKSIME